MFNCFNFRAYIRFFIKISSETTVNISNELIFFTDVYRGSFTLHAIQYSLPFDKPQKNGIHSLNILCQLKQILRLCDQGKMK